MAKPPKKISNTHPSDTSSTTPRTLPEESRVRGEHSVPPGMHLPDGAPTPGSHTSNTPPTNIPHQQDVIVSDIPFRNSTVRASNLASWPRDQVDQLKKINDTGLFMSNERTLYADVEKAGIGRVELNADGDYQVHFPFAPDYPGPLLKKIEGKPQWRFVEPWPAAPAAGSPSFITGATASVTLINPAAVKKLPTPNDQGIRWYNSRSYVDLIEEGTVQVDKNADGNYQATTPQERMPSGPVVERIEATSFWKRKAPNALTQEQRDISHRSSSAEDPGPGPSKRPRIEDHDDRAAESAAAEHTPAVSSSSKPSYNPYLWASWGEITQPAAVESVRIGSLHYRIAPKGQRIDNSAYLQPPELSPLRFDVFEQMLNGTPSKQPVSAVLNNEGQWVVQGGTRLFEKTITQSVADSFPDFTTITSRAVARSLFEGSAHSAVLDHATLLTTTETLRYWKQPTGPTTGYENPLDLLPVATRRDPQFIPLLAQTADESLRRLDFDPRGFQQQWDFYRESGTDFQLRYLLGYVLRKNGFQIFPLETKPQLSPKLVFRRPNHNRVYFLELSVITGNTITLHKTPGSELTHPDLGTQIGDVAVQQLRAANDHNAVTWLSGGVQIPPEGSPSVFIIRER